MILQSILHNLTDLDKVLNPKKHFFLMLQLGPQSQSMSHSPHSQLCFEDTNTHSILFFLLQKNTKM